jgi:uncharacterized protein
VILLDANVPMYLIGADHPNNDDARDLLGRLVRERERLATDSETFNEILHRYIAAGRDDLVEPAFEALEGLVDEVLAIEPRDVFAAKEIVGAEPRVSTRAALHVAVMHRAKIGRVVSFDRSFDWVRGIERLPQATTMESPVRQAASSSGDAYDSLMDLIFGPVEQ